MKLAHATLIAVLALAPTNAEAEDAACCLQNRRCVMLDEETCEAVDGAWAGTESTCRDDVDESGYADPCQWTPAMMYWIPQAEDAIWKAEFNGVKPEEENLGLDLDELNEKINEFTFTRIANLAVDHKRGIIYAYVEVDNGSRDKIIKAKTDGTGVEIIQEAGTAYAQNDTAIALEPRTGRLWYSSGPGLRSIDGEFAFLNSAAGSTRLVIAPEQSCLGHAFDVNGDGRIDFQDFAAFMNCYDGPDSTDTQGE